METIFKRKYLTLPRRVETGRKGTEGKAKPVKKGKKTRPSETIVVE
jgi:hypothetical protein